MYPLLFLAALSPFLGGGLWVLGAVLQNKLWALRFAVVNLSLGLGVPLVTWLISMARERSMLAEMKDQVSPADWSTIQAAARGEALALPWAALLSSPWLLSSGLALLGVALLRHPAVSYHARPDARP